MKEKVISSENVFQGHFLKVQRDLVQLPDGQQSTREYFIHNGASTILAQNEQGQFLLLKQYRHAHQMEFFEFPAGRRDGTEEFLFTAQRELLEETGYRAKHWKHLGLIHPAIGYATELIHLYFAKDLTFEATAREPGEHIEVLWKTSTEINEMIREQLITDAKTLSLWTIFTHRADLAK